MNHTRWSRSIVWAVAAIVMVLVWAGCQEGLRPGGVIATSEIPSVSTAPPIQQKAVLGATLEVATDTGKAAYTVANLQPTIPRNKFSPVKGSLWSVDVTIQTESGNTTYNANYFDAVTEDGTALLPDVGSVDPELTYGELPQGQKVAGVVAFDVPHGKTITHIVLTAGQLGTQLGLWSVP